MQGSLCKVAERVITLSPTVNPHTLICTTNCLVVFPSTTEVTCLSLLHRAYAIRSSHMHDDFEKINAQYVVEQ